MALESWGVYYRHIPSGSLCSFRYETPNVASLDETLAKGVVTDNNVEAHLPK
jgi:hypothetical protein